MKIIVCIKQVPEVAEIRFNEATGTIVREGVPNIVNPFDRRALAEAIRLRDLCGGEVVVLTLGPPQARDALVDCLGAGADRGMHLVDPAFAGSDTLATARALALIIAREGFDIVLCGKYSIDAETGQVGPELAELLGIPQVTGATMVELRSKNRIIVERETDDGFEVLDCELPVLLTAAERLIRPIKVKEPQIEAGRRKPIVQLTARELSPDPAIFGFSGSPTSVTEIRSLARTRNVQIVDGATAGEKAEHLVEQLSKRMAMGNGERASSGPGAPDNHAEPRKGPEVWVIAESIDGRLRQVTLELLGKGSELAARSAAELSAIVVGAGARAYAHELATHGADKIYLGEARGLSGYETAGYADVISEAIRHHRPGIVLFPSTSNGRDLAPRIAARLGLGLTADCIDLDLDAEERLVQHKPAFGGNIVALIVSRTRPQLATVKPGMLRALRPNPSRTARILQLSIPLRRETRIRLMETRRAVSAQVVEIEQAEAVVCVGMGVGGAEHLPKIERLARALDAQIVATRRVVDQGWLSRHHQVGLTGKIISPRLYVGVGVRGALNHTIGIQRTGTIVGINIDPKADIFKTADFGLIGDWSEIVPAISEKLEVMAVRRAGRRW